MQYKTERDDVPVVYYSKNITSDALVRLYDALKWKEHKKVGVKLSTGEPPCSNYLRPDLIKKLVKDRLNATIVECNTAYGGKRCSNKDHLEVVREHGFLDIADFDLLDEDDYMTIPVLGGEILKENYVGAKFKNYDAYLVLSHFKGHQMAGFGGAIKNLSIGFGSGESVEKSGKALLHSGGVTAKCPDCWKHTEGDENQNKFLMCMAEAAKAVCDYMNNEKGIAFINVMNRISIDCDCNGNPEEPKMKDLGICASLDSLAIDQACIDMVYSHKDIEGDTSVPLKNRIKERNGLLVLSHAEKIKLGKGSRYYKLVCID